MAGPSIPGTYEPVEQYDERKERFPQRRYVFDAKTQDLLNRIQGQQGRYAARPTAPKNFLENVLEMPGRPLQATASAVGYGLSGRNPLEGAIRGIQGQTDIRGFADVLEQQGAPEMGRLQLGPLDIKGRDIAGFGVDILGDPLTYATMGIGKAGLLGLQGGTKAATSGAARTLGQGLGERVLELEAPSLVKSLAQRAASLPGVKGLADVIDRRLMATGRADTAGLGWAQRTATRDNIAVARATSFANDMPFEMADDAHVLLKGQKTPWEDLFRTAQSNAALTPAQKAWIGKVNQEFEWWSEEAIKRTGRFEKRIMEPGEQYFARHTLNNAKAATSYMKVPVGSKKGVENARAYRTMEEGLEAAEKEIAKGGPGWSYASPIESLRLHIKDTLTMIDEEDLRKAVSPIARTVDKAELTALQGRLKTAMRGERSTAQYNALKKQYDEVTAQMEKLGDQLAPWEEERTLAAEYAKQGGDRFYNPFPGFSDETVLKVARKHGFDPYGSSDWWAPLYNAKGKLADTAFYQDLMYERPASTAAAKAAAAKETRSEMKPLLEQYDDLWKQQRQLESRMYKTEGRAMEQIEAAGGSPSDIAPLMKQAAKEAKRQREALEQEGLVPIGGQRVFRDMLFRPEDAARLERYVGAKAGPGWKKAADVVGISRTIASNADLGAGFLQGLPLLARNPLAWGRVQGLAIKAFINPTTIQRYIASPDNQEIARFYGGRLAIGSNEFTGATGQIAEFTSRFGKPGKAIGNMERRFSAAFDAVGIGARMEFGKGLRETAERSGKVGEVADLINHLTGVSSSTAWGISPTQQAIESSALFFSPRYTRATLAVIGDALTRGDVVGEEARKSLGAMLIGGISAYYKLADAMGQEPNLDPTDSRFLSFQIGGENVGIGSIWISTMRLFGKLITNPGSFMQADPKNPLIAWWRGRAAPTGQIVADLLTQENYFGEPIEGPVAQVGEAAKGILPFALQGALDPQGMTLETLPAQMAGLRVFPKNYYERRDDIAGKVGEGAPYAELTPFQQQEVSAETRKLGLPIRGDYQKEQTAIFDKHKQRVLEMATRAEQGTINKKQYKDQRQEIYARLSVELQTLKEKYPKTPQQEQAYWDKLSPREQAREQWLTILGQKDEAGQPRYEEADAFLAMLPQEIQTYIDDVGAASIGNLPPEAQEYERDLRAAKKVLRPYWQIAEDVMKERGIFDEYNEMTPAAKANFEATREYKVAQRIWERRREVYKRRNDDVREALEEWYGYAPKRRLQPFNPIAA